VYRLASTEDTLGGSDGVKSTTNMADDNYIKRIPSTNSVTKKAHENWPNPKTWNPYLNFPPALVQSNDPALEL